MIVHLVDGTYELFRHFYGIRRFKKTDPPYGAVSGVLHPPDHFSVEPEPGAEGEVPVVGAAQPDRAGTAGAQRLEQYPGRLDPVVGQSEGTGEHVGGAARDHGEGRPVRPYPLGK